MRRFHVALAVRDLRESIEDYSRRLGQAPVTVVEGKYALWRAGPVNLSINEMPDRAGQLRHVGFEDDDAPEKSPRSLDLNGIEWELFSAAQQDAEIIAVYGKPK